MPYQFTYNPTHGLGSYVPPTALSPAASTSGLQRTAVTR